MGGDLLEKLDAVKQQLQRSCDGITQLSCQHREWQQSVELLLCNLGTQLQPTGHLVVRTEMPADEHQGQAEPPVDGRRHATGTSC
eukprot:Skav235608  [mRNA]  locus=scaffold4311:47854:48108:+ [translate_table: standard]